MPNPFFTFNQFTIRHDRCAMKVGTDGVLLGAWTNVDHSHRLLDVGTGTGLIALMLAQRCPQAYITAIDIDAEAVEQARENTLSSPWKDRVEVLLQDICTFPTNQQFDTIVSNPPYIDAGDMQTLEPSVKNYEPHLALYGGEDGLDFYRAITANYRRNLKPGGYLCYEFGEDQGDDVCKILAANGFSVRQRVKDFNGTERAVIAQYCVEE